MNSFNLHIRLTKACNAECDYCSSWQEKPSRRMNAYQLLKSLIFIEKIWKRHGLSISMVSVEYVGGEILLVPPHELKDIVFTVREFFSSRNIKMVDGAQSNLIGSKARLDDLFELFSGRVGTSIDSITDQRKLAGSAEKYRTFFRESDAYFKQKLQLSAPAVVTLDDLNIDRAMEELVKAKESSRNLTFRPVFKGGSETQPISPERLGEFMQDSFDSWLFNSAIIIEPHYTLIKKYLKQYHTSRLPDVGSYCNFQSDCARKSLCIEPNGDLFVCQEMADAALYPLGNAINGEWNEKTWFTLDERRFKLDKECRRCPYLLACQGGCMVNAIQSGFGVLGRPDKCSAWKMLFSRFDRAIAHHGVDKIDAWLQTLNGEAGYV